MNGISSLFTTNGVTDSDRILHTPSDFAKKNLLFVQEVGKLKSLQPHKSQRKNLDSFLFIGVLNGEGIINIGEGEYPVKKGDCAFINCLEYYAHESSKKKPWELVWVHFNGTIAKAYYELFLNQNADKNIFCSQNINEAEGIIDDLMLYQKEKDLEAELKSGNRLLELLNLCLITALHKEKKNHENNRILCNEIREIVNEKYQEKDLLSFLEKKFGKSEEELNFFFIKMYGIEIRDFILNRRFNAAKELLRFTIKPVNDIIKESGIYNDDLFRKMFQDNENMTAEEYRMKWAQWIK